MCWGWGRVVEKKGWVGALMTGCKDGNKMDWDTKYFSDGHGSTSSVAAVSKTRKKN